MNVIYDDIIYSLQKAGGISMYWMEMENRISVNNRIVYSGREKNIFYKEHDSIVEDKRNPSYTRYMNLRLKDIKEPFIFHSSYYRYSKNPNAKNITTIYDFNYEYYNHGFKLFIHHFQKKRAIMNSAGIICISQNPLDDLKKFFPKYKGNVTVIGLGYSKEYYHLPETKRQKKAVYVGARGGYKNFKLAVEIVKELPNVSLLVVGGGALSKEEREMLDSFLPNRYEKLGYVENNELAEIYNKALCLLYTSDYEGFGIPALEAMACGCPVVCQKKASLPEVCGDAGIYIYNDSKNAVQEVSKLLDDTFFEQISKSSIEQSKKFSWERTAKETEIFYKSILE